MKDFLNGLEKTLKNDFNESITENGMIGFKSTMNPIVDMTFRVSSYRNDTEEVIVNDFAKAYYFDKLIALKWLFYVRDIRQGLGERRLFRICMNWLADNHTSDVIALSNLISEYGRWDDLIELLKINHPSIKKCVISIINKQLNKDIINVENGKPISLLAKWLPSINASSKETNKLGREIAHKLYPQNVGYFTPEKYYRRMLSKLRKYLNVVEVKMSKNDWNKIQYNSVPSKANLIYKDAFYRHDEERYVAFINDVKKGKEVIHSETNFPHDIVHKYYNRRRSFWENALSEKDEVLEQLWKALPNYVKDNSTTLVVADGSGSMNSCIQSNSLVKAIEVAESLAIYFAERCKGPFKDKYITFSERPQLVNLSCEDDSLRSKLEIASHYNEVANTNIRKVFDLILKTATNNHLAQEDLPQNVLILSDMEFDSCSNDASSQDFKVIQESYKNAGYKVPKLIFWNICSRTKTIPILENDLGVILVSGFSPSILNMVLTNESDPYKVILDVLNSERYAPIEDALK